MNQEGKNICLLLGGINHSTRVLGGQVLPWKQGGFWSTPVALRLIRSWEKRERHSTRLRVVLERVCTQMSVLVFAFSLPTLELEICFLAQSNGGVLLGEPLGDP